MFIHPSICWNEIWRLSSNPLKQDASVDAWCDGNFPARKIRLHRIKYLMLISRKTWIKLWLRLVDGLYSRGQLLATPCGSAMVAIGRNLHLYLVMCIYPVILKAAYQIKAMYWRPTGFCLLWKTEKKLKTLVLVISHFFGGNMSDNEPEVRQKPAKNNLYDEILRKLAPYVPIYVSVLCFFGTAAI